MVQILRGIVGGHGYPDLTHHHADVSADLQQLGTNGGSCASANSAAFQSQSQQPADQHISRCREIQPHLIGTHRLRAELIRKSTELFLNAISISPQAWNSFSVCSY